MFTIVEREDICARLLEHARTDERIVAAAITGSAAIDAVDEWSDVDLFFGVRDDVGLDTVVDAWTELLAATFGLVHHWDLASPTTTYRVFLLPNGLEVDIGFAHTQQFVSRGARFRPVFGDARAGEPHPAPATDDEIGLAWHHVLHARACIERGKPWQAAWLIGGVRDHTVTLASLRLGVDPYFARGADALPAELRGRLESTLVHSLETDELRRALGAATDAFVAELREHDAELAARLEPILRSAT